MGGQVYVPHEWSAETWMLLQLAAAVWTMGLMLLLLYKVHQACEVTGPARETVPEAAKEAARDVTLEGQPEAAVLAPPAQSTAPTVETTTGDLTTAR